MLERRLRHNLLLLLLTFVIGLGLYEMIAGPGPPPSIRSAADSALDTPPAYTPITNQSHVYAYPYHTLPPDDYARLIDLTAFKFEQLNEPCATSPLNDSVPVLLLVLVHSAPKNFAKRRTIRDTWGRQTAAPASGMRLVFMVGAVPDPTLQAKLVAENDRFSDMAQGSFMDTYRNVTYKHVMVFKYTVYHCPQARYVLKTDDDVFVNTPSLLTFLSDAVSPYGARGLLMCWLRNNELAIRSYRSKWRVSFDEFPDKRYPPYCPGWAVLYSPDVLFQLYRAAQNATYFWIDDVFVTGVLFRAIRDYRHTDLAPYMLTKRDQNEILYGRGKGGDPSVPAFLFSRPDLNETEIRRLDNFTIAYNSRHRPAGAQINNLNK